MDKLFDHFDQTPWHKVKPGGGVVHKDGFYGLDSRCHRCYPARISGYILIKDEDMYDPNKEVYVPIDWRNAPVLSREALRQVRIDIEYGLWPDMPTGIVPAYQNLMSTVPTGTVQPFLRLE